MKDRSIYILIFWCLIFFPSFAKEEENTPKHLPNNKESDKVIGYFRCCNDSLKYKSALFLLSNMPFNYSICGDNIDEYEKACRKIAYKPKELRSKLYKQVSTNINKNSWKPVSDICMLNSQYLINYINKSVDNWENQTWSKEYSWDDFFNYVLPYRISNEPLSNWHQTIDIEYPYLNGSHYWSNRGIQFDFSKAILSSSDTCHVIGASKDKVVSLNQNNSKVSFHFFQKCL